MYVYIYHIYSYISSHIIPSCLVKSPGDFSHPKCTAVFRRPGRHIRINVHGFQACLAKKLGNFSGSGWRLHLWTMLLFFTQTMRHGYFSNICDWRFHYWTMLKYPCDPLKHGYFSLILSRKHGHFPSFPKIWHGPPFIHFSAAYMVNTKINNEMEWCTLGTLAGRTHGFGYCTKTGGPPEEETAWQFVHLALLIPPFSCGRKLGILKNTAMTNPCIAEFFPWQWILSCIQCIAMANKMYPIMIFISPPRLPCRCIAIAALRRRRLRSMRLQCIGELLHWLAGDQSPWAPLNTHGELGFCEWKRNIHLIPSGNMAGKCHQLIVGSSHVWLPKGILIIFPLCIYIISFIIVYIYIHINPIKSPLWYHEVVVDSNGLFLSMKL